MRAPDRRSPALEFWRPLKSALIAALAISPIVAQAQLGKSSWPEARADYANTGISSATGGFLLPRWTTAPAGGAASAPAVGADGNFYVGDNEGNLLSINASTGAVNWTLALGTTGPSDFVVGSPVIGPAGAIYVATNAGVLYAVSTGQNGMNPTITGSYESASPISMSPVVGPNGMVYIASGITFKSINPSTMNPNWQALFTSAQCLPAFLADNSQMFVAGNGTFVALQPTSGQPIWQIVLQSPKGVLQKPTGAITVAGTIAIVEGSTGLFGIDLNKQAIAWYTDFTTLKGAASSPISLSPDLKSFYFDTSGLVYGMSVSTGGAAWVSDIQNPTKASGVTAVGSDGTIYDVTDGLNITALSAIGVPLWSYNGHASSPLPAAGISIGPDGAILATDKTHLQATWGNAFLSMAFSPTSVIGGSSSTGTISTQGVASQDLTFSLSAPTGAGVITFPQPTVTLKAGSTSANFTVSTLISFNQSSLPIIANGQNGGIAADLLVNPIAISTLTYIPTVVGGTQDQCSVIVNATAPAGGLSVSLSSNNAALAPPASVTIPAGQNTIAFPVSTNYVGSPTKAVLTASLGNNISANATITVTPAALYSITFPSPTVAGSSGNAFVYFNGPVENTTLVTLKSSDPNLSVPGTVSVNAGTSAGTIQYTSKITTARTVSVTATYNGSSVTVSVSLVPLALTGLTITPTAVLGGANLTGTVSLNGNAMGTGFAVTVKAAPASVLKVSSGTIPAGYSSAAFAIPSVGVSKPTSVTVTATGPKGAGTASTTVTVNPPALTGMSVAPSKVAGLGSATGQVTLGGKAASSGVKVTLTSSNPAVVIVPATANVASGASGASFTVKTKSVASSTAVTITASLGTASFSSQLTVTPPGVTKLTISPTSVKPGKTTKGTVTISAAAPAGGMTITLSGGSSSVSVPSTVTVKAGATSGTFTISASSSAQAGRVTITATSAGGASQSATLTVT